MKSTLPLLQLVGSIQIEEDKVDIGSSHVLVEQ
jgi:hypothetical protein